MIPLLSRVQCGLCRADTTHITRADSDQGSSRPVLNTNTGRAVLARLLRGEGLAGHPGPLNMGRAGLRASPEI